MNIKVPYKYCITFKQQCKKAKKNGFCSNKDKENCIAMKRLDKLFW